ncbi:sensor histidine kinase [Paenibacillus andongensis]|uniref:sensor histidine kinase n=1 Tax=Paenibacillus andongensis TaxID=2975482 RepID=UPI0021BA9A5F|nr:HAMP domain-containing sensor histidine kinase [Paenibacillus andongensis]
MKTLKIRRLMLFGMLIILVIPRLFYEIPGMLDRYVFERNLQTQQQIALTTVVSELTANISFWRDASWQSALREKTIPYHMGVLLLDSADREIFRSAAIESGANPARQASVVEGGQLLGNVLLYMPDQGRGSVTATICAVLSAILAILFIGYQMGQVVVKPLEAMSAAAKRIAGGDLDFELPGSTVAEIADVRASFQAMGNGLRESLTRQSKLEEERRFFISAIAHDLRSPLFVLRGFLTRLERGLTDNPEKISRYITICSHKAEQLDRLVSDLFAYTKMEYMGQIQRLEQVEFNTLLSETLDDYHAIAREKQLAIVYDPPDEPCMLQGDAHLLSRAVRNVLDNALRHTPSNGTIKVKCYMEKNQISFIVEDTGPGIADQDLPHIFEPFYRGDESRNPDSGATGLGLTISRRILRAHSGDLIVQNRSTSGGAIFTGWIS